MKKVIVVIVILAVIGGLIGLSYFITSNMSEVFSQGTVYSVKAAEIGKDSISSFITASGIVEEVESFDIYVDNPTKVNKLLVKKYQNVSKDQQLMELDIETLENELDKLKINKKVQELSKNSPTIDAEIKRAESGVKSAEKALSDYEENYEKSKKLFEAQAISKNDLDMAEKAVTDAKTALDNAKVAYDAAVKNRNVDRDVKEENLNATILGIAELEKRIKNALGL